MSSSSKTDPTIAVRSPPAFLSAPSTPTIPWTTWFRMFTNYITAAGLSSLPDVRQKAILLNTLGTEGQRIFYTFPKADALSYNDSVKALSDHFQASINVVAERYRFRSRAQMPGESIDNWIAHLRELSANCEFATLNEEMIRDQLVEKVLNPQIREKLLQEKRLTLDEALVIARQMEVAKREAATFSPASEVRAVSYKDPKKKPAPPTGSNSKGHCYRCGRKDHNAAAPTCPARNAKCRSCSKTGHFGKVCRSQKSVNVVQPDSSPSTPASPVSEDGEIVQLLNVVANNISSNKYIFHNVELQTGDIQDSSVRMLLDTGSIATIVPKSVFEDRFSEIQLQPPPDLLVSYDQQPLQVVGGVRAKLTVDNSSCEIFLYIVEKGQAILGLDAIRKLRLSVPLHHVSASHVPQEFLNDFPHVFSGDITTPAKGFMHAPKVDDSIPPVAQRLRRLPLSVRDNVKQELLSLEEKGIIERVDASKWVSNPVIVRKADSSLRICVDLKNVNKAIVPDKYPLPTTTELTAKLHGSKVFSKIDLKMSYLQIELAPESRDLTTIITHEGLFRYKRVCFGLSSAPSAFHKMLASVLAGLEGDGVIHYIDDILISSETEMENKKIVSEVLKRLSKHNLVINNDKSVFFANEIEFLGHKISKDGISPLQSNTKAIESLRMPTNVKELSSFLGATNYYLKFVPHYSDITEPLRRLLRKNTQWEWTDECIEACEKLKHMLTSSPILAHYNAEAKTLVTCDASAVSIGAVLSQIQPDGSERPVAYLSRSLSQTERKYSAGEREALACIFACEKWHLFLYGKRFTLQTDHRALTALLATSGSGHRPLRIYRWSDRLQQYDFDVIYRPGSMNQVADMLSRLPNDDSTNTAQDEISDRSESVVQQIFSKSVITPNKLAEATSEDSVLKTVLQFVKTAWPDKRTMKDKRLHPYYSLRHELWTWNDNRCLARGPYAIIPDSLRQEVTEMAHQGHPGIVRTKQRCREVVWWPKMDGFINEFVKTCVHCTLTDKRQLDQTPISKVQWPSRPWESLQIDIAGEFKAAPIFSRFLLVVTDLHSKWPEIAMCSAITSSSVIHFLSDLFVRWGIPDRITSDNGTQFTSHEFTDFLARMGIEHIRTPLYSPQANGGVERLNRSIKESLKAQLAEGVPFSNAVQNFLLTYRSTPHALTSKSPAELMLGRKLKLPLHSIAPLSTPLTDAQETLAKSVQDKKNKIADKHNQKLKIVCPLKVDDYVRVRRPFSSDKLQSSLSKPMRIDKLEGPCTVRLEDGTMWSQRRCVKVPAPSCPSDGMDASRSSHDIKSVPVPEEREEEFFRVNIGDQNHSLCQRRSNRRIRVPRRFILE